VSESIAGDEPAADWVGCLVLVLAAESLEAAVADAVVAAERSILSDPVLADMARVSTPQNPISLHGGLDEIALRLYQEMTTWGASPARNPAPRFTFCLLTLHDDLEAADRLVRELAGTELLGDLPILFRLEQVAAADPGRPAVGAVDELVQLMVDAVTATALEVETAPQFCLSRSSLATVTARRRLALAGPRPSQPAPQPAPPPTRPTVPAPHSPTDHHSAGPTPSSQPRRFTEPGDVVGGATAAPDGGPAPKDGPPSMSGVASASGEPQTPSLPQEATPRTGSAAGSWLPRRRRGTSNVETIDRLSQRATEASVLYLVLVSEPTRPARSNRRLRADVALQVARTVLGVEHPGDTPWIVRVFEAGETLHDGSLFADAATVTRRSFRQRWGEYLDFYECTGDLSQNVHHDMSSFARRGLRWARSVTVFLAGGPLEQSGDEVSRFRDLSTRTETIWVSFGRATSDAGDVGPPGDIRQLRHHEDILSEMVQLIAGPSDNPLPDSSGGDPPERAAAAAPSTIQTRPPTSPHHLIETDGAG
jgi:hypothetical protein